MSMEDTRITHLEEQLAHQAKTLDELNAVVTEQAEEIAILTRRMRMVMERLAEAEIASSDGTVPLADQKPPHW